MSFPDSKIKDSLRAGQKSPSDEWTTWTGGTWKKRTSEISTECLNVMDNVESLVAL
jgi:hypothetical protein